MENVPISMSGNNVPIEIETIFNEMSKYKVTKGCWHCGDLLEHSIWTMLFVDDALIDKYSPLSAWLGKLSPEIQGSNFPKLRRLINLTALFHDIGKAGDGVMLYTSKPNHPYVGAMYTLSGYINPPDERSIDFHQVLSKMGLETYQLPILAALIYSHWDFGNHLCQGIKNNDLRGSARNFVNETMDKIRWVGGSTLNGNLIYRDDFFSYFETLMLISAADVMGSMPYIAGVSSKLYPYIVSMMSPRKDVNNYKKCGFDSHGLIMKGLVMDILNEILS